MNFDPCLWGSQEKGECRVNQAMAALQKTKGCFVMQYTGIKDRTGKEIYEGDVVAGDKGFRGKVMGAVEYHGMAFSFVGKQEDGTRWIYTITSPWEKDDNVEVIGNIYSNPELLKNVSSL